MRALVILLTMAVCVAAWSGTTFGIYDDPCSGERSFDVCATESLTPQLGAFGYIYASPTWSEAYAGPTWGPNNHWQLALGYGTEQAQSDRYGGWIWYGRGKFAATYAFEGSGSGSFNKGVIQYQATPWLNIGVLDKTGAGLGGKVDLTVQKDTKLRLEYFKAGTTQVGLRFDL